MPESLRIKLWQQLLGIFCNTSVPPEYLRVYFGYMGIDTYEYQDEGFNNLQDWVLIHLKPEFDWMTGIGIITSIEINITEAKGNGTLDHRNPYSN